MAQKRDDDTPTTLLEATSTSMLAGPRWFALAILVLGAVRDSPFGLALTHLLRVPRGRAGLYEPLDFALVLIAFAASEAVHLNDFYQQIPQVASALAALWDRQQLPSRAALSRFLAVLTDAHVRTVSAWLLDDLIAHGARGPHLGGLFDRDGARTIVFDVDGTYHGARQRELADDEDRPPARRRAASLCAKGYYGGGRRADVTRNRSVLQQAHTQEWLGTWSAPGNGEPFTQLEFACAAVVRYLAAHGLAPGQGLIRLDGLYGYARVAAILARAGVGYLFRCADYRLLELDYVHQVVASTPPVLYQAPDSPVLREAWQVEHVSWVAAKDPTDAVVTRRIITRRPAIPGKKPRVGKLLDGQVYELFATDRSATGWSIEDVLQTYFARGGFEGTLAQEDRERDLDRTRSFQSAGQSFWTVLGQLVANVRLRLGATLAGAEVRRTLWSPPVAAMLEARTEASREAPREIEASCSATSENPPLEVPEEPDACAPELATANPVPRAEEEATWCADPAPVSTPTPSPEPSAEPTPEPSAEPTPEPTPKPTPAARGRIAEARGRSQGR